MSTRGEELNLRVTATDQASAIVDKVADKVGDLEDREHQIPLDADASPAEREIAVLDRRLAGLTADEKRIILQLTADKAERDIAKINRELANAAKYDDDEIALRLTARGDLEAKIQAARSELRELDGETARVDVQVDADQIDKAQAKVRELDGATARVDVRTTGLDELSSQLDAIGLGRAGGLLSKAGAGPAAIVGGLVLGANSLADSYSTAAANAENLSRFTGDTVENASRLNILMGQFGVEATDVQDILLQMTDVLSRNPDLVERLGINLADGRTGVERLVQVVGILNTQVDSAADRALLFSQLFGEEGARQVNAVTTAVGDLGRAIEDIPDARVVNAEQAEAARKYREEMAEAKGEIAAFTNELAQTALPALTGMLSVVNDISAGIQDWTGSGLGSWIGRIASINPLSWFDAPGKSGVEQLEDQTMKLAESFDLAQLAGLETFGAVRERVIELTDNLDLANLVALRWADTHRDQVAPALDDVAGAAEDAAARISSSLSSAWQSTVDAARNAIAEAEAAALNAVLDPLDKESGALRLLDDFDRLNEAAAAAYKARAEGAADADKKERQFQLTLNQTIAGTTNYLTKVLELPLERTTRLRSLLEQGDLIAAQREFERLTSQWVIAPKIKVTSAGSSVQFQINPGSAPTLVGGSTATALDQNALNALAAVVGGAAKGETNIYYAFEPSAGQVAAAQRARIFTGDGL